MVETPTGGGIAAVVSGTIAWQLDCRCHRQFAKNLPSDFFDTIGRFLPCVTVRDFQPWRSIDLVQATVRLLVSASEPKERLIRPSSARRGANPHPTMASLSSAKGPACALLRGRPPFLPFSAAASRLLSLVLLPRAAEDNFTTRAANGAWRRA